MDASKQSLIFYSHSTKKITLQVNILFLLLWKKGCQETRDDDESILDILDALHNDSLDNSMLQASNGSLI